MKVFVQRHFHNIAALLVIGTFTLFSHDTWKAYKLQPPYQFKDDVVVYYSYLPALFCYGDLSFRFDNIHSFWLTEGKEDRMVPRFTMGMAYLYCPFFFDRPRSGHRYRG